MNYTSFSLDPTLKWSEMTKHLRRDDANPSEDLSGSQLSAIILNKIFPEVNYIEFLQYKSYCWNLISYKAALQRLYCESAV